MAICSEESARLVSSKQPKEDRRGRTHGKLLSRSRGVAGRAVDGVGGSHGGRASCEMEEEGREASVNGETKIGLDGKAVATRSKMICG